MNTFSAELSASLKEVDSVLEAEFEGIQNESLSGAIRSVLNPRGKMLRPAIGFSLYSVLGGLSFPNTPNFVGAAAGIELIHRATLLPDDLFDQSPTRRGEPSAYLVYGSEVAVLAPILMTSKAQVLISRNAREHRLSEKRLRYVDGCIVDCAQNLIVGELSDLEGLKRNLAEVRTCQAQKNCLFDYSCTLPAVFLELNDDLVRTVVKFGNALSDAYQHKDDLADLLATPEQVGKPVRQDKDSVARRIGVDEAKTLFYSMRTSVLKKLAAIPGASGSEFERVVEEALSAPYL